MNWKLRRFWQIGSSRLRTIFHAQMALSTQCGFASAAAGNPIRPATQQAKLKLVADLARRLFS
jgi:hypothetical protein